MGARKTRRRQTMSSARGRDPVTVIFEDLPTRSAESPERVFVSIRLDEVEIPKPVEGCNADARRRLEEVRNVVMRNHQRLMHSHGESVELSRCQTWHGLSVAPALMRRYTGAGGGSVEGAVDCRVTPLEPDGLRSRLLKLACEA